MLISDIFKAELVKFMEIQIKLLFSRCGIVINVFKYFYCKNVDILVMWFAS